ncbi:ABC-2 type transport system permease protein [Balneicella halophila]|uniref:ABC-2 type transport system permease protein n=1 Tax=Balneicella halophila TaxID=1537566 RepID=A0A7L4USJ3_BALHA|nr:ABC transporter permease [Balneicella halophila]PVX51954.1 ABC-2 type transport system permease protein [Balneicella halophila]
MLRRKIHSGFLGVFHIWKLEMKKIFRDEGIILFFIIVPLAYPILYTSLYNPEVLRELPVAVVDNSKSALSREYIRKVDATPDVSVQSVSVDMPAAKRLMMEEKVYGIIHIPSDFSTNIMQAEKQAIVSVFIDMGSLLYYKAIMVANTDVSLQMNREIKIQRKSSTEREEQVYAYPIEYEHINIFNSASGFASFLIPAVLILILHQTLLLGVGLLAGTEREQSRFNDMIALHKHHRGTLRLILGKGLAYFMIYLFNTAYVLFLVPAFFNLPQLGHTFDILLFLIPFLLATVFFSMTLSTLVQNRETCIVLFVFSSVPLLFISGISWPSTGIPPFWESVSYLFPSTFGINGYVRLSSMGAQLHQVKFEFIGLYLQLVFYFITTFIVYRREIFISQLHKKHHWSRLRKIREKANRTFAKKPL